MSSRVSVLQFSPLSVCLLYLQGRLYHSSLLAQCKPDLCCVLSLSRCVAEIRLYIPALLLSPLESRFFLSAKLVSLICNVSAIRRTCADSGIVRLCVAIATCREATDTSAYTSAFISVMSAELSWPRKRCLFLLAVCLFMNCSLTNKGF